MLDDAIKASVSDWGIAELGHIPDVGERVAVDGGTLEVAAMAGNRITQLTLHPSKSASLG